MSYISDYIARQRLILQAENQAFNQTKFAIEQQNFERKMQADLSAENRRIEANLQSAKIQAQSQFESKALEGILQGLNQTQAFFQAEFAKQTQHNLDRQKLAYETRANILLERLRNNAEINKAKVAAKLEIERMVKEKELQKDYLVFEKYCDIFFRLLERDLGLNVMELNAEQIERYAAEAFEQLGLLDG